MILTDCTGPLFFVGTHRIHRKNIHYSENRGFIFRYETFIDLGLETLLFFLCNPNERINK